MRRRGECDLFKCLKVKRRKCARTNIQTSLFGLQKCERALRIETFFMHAVMSPLTKNAG